VTTIYLDSSDSEQVTVTAAPDVKSWIHVTIGTTRLVIDRAIISELVEGLQAVDREPATT